VCGSVDLLTAEWLPPTICGAGSSTGGGGFFELFEGDYLMLLRPFMDFSLFYEITESAPVKLTKGHGTFEFDFMVTDTDYFPIAPARTLLYVDLLPYLKRIGPEHCNPITCHLFSFPSPDKS
jgi:hypothetical protein